MLSMTSQKKETKETVPPSVTVEEKPLVPKTGEGLGLALPNSEKKVETQEEKTEVGPQVKVVGPPAKDEEAEATRREAEEIRRRKLEAGQQALSSSLMIRRKGPKSAASSENTSGSADQGERSYTPAGPDAYDPAADQDKEAFFARADATQWLSPYTREAVRKYEIKTGTVIPGVMVSGINSDLPGNLIAQVSQNVYDTATGGSLLIPQGSKLYGVYDSRVVYGQLRVLIAWNCVIFPDGSSVTLGAMPGADLAG
jgi:type IV secretion system protein VirB10